ncbi:MAG: hypothetical protein JXB04_03065 [Kiritimatiellae bacterium]|nr:hypothetical protein [Kiritimatiellia bacterium]
MRKLSAVVAAVLLLLPAAAPAELVSGRTLPPRTFSLSLEAGQVTSVEGEIQETKRAGTDIPGWDAGYGFRLENYSLEQLGFDESYFSLGLALEKQWTFFTFRMDMSYVNPTAAETASRDYYIGVEEIDFNGREYEYMMIPRGTRYDADIQGGIVALKGLFTPFSLTQGDMISLTPWIQLGLFGLFGRYEIDAGPARDVTTYETPPRQYVVGGKATGWAGAALPNLGLGGEAKFRVGQTEAGPVILSVQGGVGFLEYTGDTDSLGINARDNKDLDLSYMEYEIRTAVEIPMSETSDLLVGLRIEHVEGDTTVEAKGDVTGEKYDKDVDFEMNRVLVTAGLRF